MNSKLTPQREQSIRTAHEQAREGLESSDLYSEMSHWGQKDLAARCARSHFSAIPLAILFEIENEAGSPEIVDKIARGEAVVLEFLPVDKQRMILAALTAGSLRQFSVASLGLSVALQRDGLVERLWQKLLGIKSTNISRAMKAA
jgi:hypothetical protein